MKLVKEFNTSRCLKLQNFLDTIDFRVVRTKEELEKASTLVHREYIKKGYIKETNSGLRLAIHNAHPQTTTFVAMAGKEVIATTTVIPDSPLGLPMDEVFHQELNQLRKGDKQLCEISMLASDTELFNDGVSMMLNSKKLFLLFYLFKHIFDYTKKILKPDFICITINPRHKLTYDFLLCKDLAGIKTYHNVNEAPAVAKYVDLSSVEEEYKRQDMKGLYKMFFRKETNPTKFSNKYNFTYQDLKYFFAEKTDVFKTASSPKIGYLKRCYPSYDFSKLICNKQQKKISIENNHYWWDMGQNTNSMTPFLSLQN